MSWLREDLSSGSYGWLRPDFVLPSPFLVIKNPQTQSRILVEPHLIEAECRKAWMPFFCRSGHPVINVDQFGLLWVTFHPKRLVFSFLGLQCVSCRKLRGLNGGLDGWAWNEVKALPLPWFSGLAILFERDELARTLSKVESTGVWPRGHWMPTLP